MKRQLPDRWLVSVAALWAAACAAEELDPAAASRRLCAGAIELLQSDSRSNRLRYVATQIVAKLLDEEAAKAALTLLDDKRKDDHLRRMLAGAFGRIGFRPAAPALARLVRDSSVSLPTRSAALSALKTFGDGSVVPAMRSGLSSDSRSERIFCATVLVTFGDESGAGESTLLTEMTRCPEDDLASWQALIEGVAVARSKKAIPGLIELRSGKPRQGRYSKYLARYASRALWRITLCDIGKTYEAQSAWWQEHQDTFRPLRATKEDAPLLVAKMNGTVSWWAASAASEMLKEIGTDAIPALRAGLFAEDLSASRIIALLGALGEVSIPTLVEALGVRDAASTARSQLIALGQVAAPALARALAAPQSTPALRARAIELLAAVKATSAVPQIADAVSDDDTSVRLAAFRALGWMGDQDTEEAIGQGLTDSDEAVRKAANVALAQLLLRTGDALARETGALRLAELEDRTGVELLVAALNDPAREVTLAAVEALGKLGARVSLPALARTAKHGDPDLAGAAIIACGRISSKAALREVMTALKSDRPALREAAVIALQQGRRENTVPGLLQVLREDPAPLPRRLAALALAQVGDKSVVPDLIAGLGKEQGEAKRDYQDALTTLTGQKGPRTVEEWKKWWQEAAAEEE